MPRAVCAPGYYQRDDGRHDKDGNAAHLCRLRGVPKVTNDSRCEETGGVASVDNANVHDDAAVDLPIAEDAFACWPIETVHFCIGDVDAQAGDEQSPFVVVEEFGGFGPVWDQPFGDDGDAAGDDALSVDEISRTS